MESKPTYKIGTKGGKFFVMVWIEAARGYIPIFGPYNDRAAAGAKMAECQSSG